MVIVGYGVGDVASLFIREGEGSVKGLVRNTKARKGCLAASIVYITLAGECYGL